MVNSIVNRYKSFCDKFGVKMNIDIRSADFSFMSEPDITALLDNLLENAVEAAQNTENGFIDFSAFVRKNKYLSIQLTNSVKNIVAVKNNRIASSKKSDAIHGTVRKSNIIDYVGWTKNTLHIDCIEINIPTDMMYIGQNTINGNYG